MSATEAAGLDGLAQLQGMMTTGRQAAIGETLAFSVVEVDRGHAVFEGRPDRSVYNR